MKREIKFRGKHIDSGEWLIGDLVQDHFGDGSINTCHIYPKDAWNGPDCYEVDSATVGQYTGLKDKDGKEIYEGDIVKALRVGGRIGYLEFYNGSWFITDGAWHEQSLCSALQGKLEVVGNIHDTPELLKGGAR